MPTPAAIGVDVGGTKTHLRVWTADGDGRDLVVPTRTWWRTGTSITEAPNAGALTDLLPPHQPGSALVVGAHGVDSEPVRAQFRTNLAGSFTGAVEVLNDAALAGPAAGYLGPVITVICGTGSIVLSADGRGGEVRLGGHGYLLGDEGAAPALVGALARAVLRDQDRGGSDQVALVHLAEAAGVPESPERAVDLAAALHHHHTATDWGRLAPAVFAAADAGSPLASAVIAAHARELVEVVGLHLAAGARPEAVVLAGGVVTAQPRLADAITQGIKHLQPRLPVVLLDAPPVAGAVTLARRLLGADGGSDAMAPATASPTQMRNAHLERSES